MRLHDWHQATAGRSGSSTTRCSAPPAAQSFRRTAAHGFEPARELAHYRAKVWAVWPKVAITDVDSTGLPDTPLLGSELTLTATVRLAGLRPDEVEVQAVFGRVDGTEDLHAARADDSKEGVHR